MKIPVTVYADHRAGSTRYYIDNQEINLLVAAPIGASYVCISNDAILTNERALAVSSPLVITDGGAGGAVTVGFSNQIANTVLAGPAAGAPAAPAFRALVAADLPGSFGGFANPTAQVGLAAVNGVATTAMRSDAAPALDQGITPTWTARHLFSNTLNALTDLSDPTYYHLAIRNPSDDTGEMIGVAFYISSENNDVGGAIGFYRTDANSMGELRFYTKQSTADATDPVLVLTLNDAGNVVPAANIVMSEDAWIGLGSSDVRLIFDSTPATHQIRLAGTAGSGVAALALGALGNLLVLDADYDTALRCSGDDTVVLAISGADDFQFSANTFGVLSGSSITMADDTWIGLGGAAGRIVFDDQATDQIYVKDAQLFVGDYIASTNFSVNENTSETTLAILISQDGSGDCGIRFRLGSTQDYAMAIDNSDSDKFKFTNSSGVSSGTVWSVTTAGIMSIVQESWTAVAGFSNSWTNFGAGYNDAAYIKDSMGFVHLRGVIDSGTLNAAAFTLPAGYRPTARELHVTIANSALARCDILSTGEVIPVSGSNVWFSLDGITFAAA